MEMCKAAKRSIGGYLILCLLVSLSATLQVAASAAQESYDYTLAHHVDQVSPIQEEAHLDMEDMPEDLATIFNAIPKPTEEPDARFLQLLALVTYDLNNQHYDKYLFASNGLLPSNQAQQKAHNLNYHLVKAPAGPVIWQVLSFLNQRSYLEVKGLILPKDTPVCLPCGHMCMHLFGKKMPVHKAGCQGQPFPTTAGPTSAIACFYSDRFTDQQRRLVISQIGDKAFPEPKKRITSPLFHDPHKLPAQPIQPVATQNQLHTAVQLHFPPDTIKLLLTSPKVAINALDSSGKTPLDYATQGSTLYALLVGHNAKTSQQLTQSQAPALLSTTAALASLPSEKGQQQAHKAAEEDTLPVDQLLIPANGQCLYTTIIMGYLLPVRQAGDEVNARIDQLFGLQPAYYINELHQTLENPTDYLTYLHSDAFGTLVTAFMARMRIKKGTWGGPQEIQTIATRLKVNIQAYYPDPSNPTHLVTSDLTEPDQANSPITLHIVRDKVHPTEVLTQEQKVSAKDNPHYQHYRLKYTLPTPVLPTTHTAIPAIQMLAPTQSAKSTTLTVPSAAPMDADTTIHPLKSLLDNPHQIAWQGLVDMAAYGDMLQKTYAIVTIEGMLYTLRKKNNPDSLKALPPVDRIIHLADYGFVLNIDMDKPDSFVLAKVNPANTTLTTDNAFTLDRPIPYALADELSDDQFNICQHFPVLYEFICTCLQKDKDKTSSDTSVSKDIPQAIPLLYTLRTIPHNYFYIDAQNNAIYALREDTTLIEAQDKDKAQQEKEAEDSPPAEIFSVRRWHDGELNAPPRRPLRSPRGGTRHTASATQQGVTIDTTRYHLVKFLYKIAGDHTATTTCYCLVPPSYDITYQQLVHLLIIRQRIDVQKLTYMHSDQPLQDKKDTIDWHVAKKKTFQVYFDLAPHFLQIPDRILWQGWAYFVPYGAKDQQSYCLITDDDKLYAFKEQPDVKRPFHAKIERTIDLAHYSFVHSDPDNLNRLILSRTNPALQQPTAANTFICYTVEPEMPPIAAEDKAHTTPSINNDTLLYTLRQATHQYHYMQSIDKQPTLCAFDQAAPLDTTAYHLVQISCQTETHHTSTNLYCLLPHDYQSTYQAFAQLWQAYFRTNTLQLTHHGQKTSLETNQTHIHWDTQANKAFCITLPATISKKVPCRLKKAKDPAKAAFRKEKSRQKQVKKAAQNESERREERLANPQSVVDLFAYEAKFAKMHKLDLWALDPLYQLKDPRLLLKKLLVEVIENGYWPDLGRGCDLVHIKNVKYVTPKECTWLAKVQAKIDCNRHNTLGKPLNIAEMTAIKLYTDSKYSYPDLCLSQRTGHLDKWIVWDQLLMTALLKLHLAELDHKRKHRKYTYSGLVDITFKVKERIGFFKTYVSTSKRISKALEFTANYGMLMYITPEMQQQFINGDVSWISRYPEGEILFARSADITEFPAPTWKATVQGYLVYDPKQYECVLKDVQEVQRYGLMGIQKVNFSPAAAPLIIPKGTTHTLPAQAMSHAFSYIKIEEDAILTIVPWQKVNQNGGYLAIRCYGDCMLGKNAKINVSAKGYSGSTSPQYDGHGPRGGATGTYCAAGGSNSTAGGSGDCRDAFAQATAYHASSPAAYGQVILAKDTLNCGSGGGYLAYPHSNDTGLSVGANGVPGGGALYLEIDGDLQLAENTAFLANGGEATPLTGGAGSGGSICLALKGEVTFTNDKAKLRLNAQGGDNQKAIAPRAQGAGGAGHITLYMNPQNQHALKRFVTQPPALVLRRTQVVQRKNYKDILVDDYLIAQGIPFAAVKRFWQWLEREEMEEDAIMDDMEAATPSQSNIYQFDKAIFQVLQHFMATLAPQQLPNSAPPTPVISPTIPDHVTMVGKYYNTQGEAHTEKADYPQAVLYHKAALALQIKKYGKQPHPDKADTLLYCAKVAAYQGNYTQAIKDGTAALDIREKLYQSNTPAHTSIIEARNQLSWLDYQQGRHTEALQRLEETLQLWKDYHGDQQELLLVDTYNYIGLIKQSLGQYQQAIDHYHKKAENMAQSTSGVDNSLRATTLHYIGQAQTQMGQYPHAIATHHEEMNLLEKLHGQDTPHPDKARSLRGEALAYLKQGNSPVAMQQYRTALAQLKKIYGEKANHPDMAAALSGIARSYAAQGNYHLATLFHEKSQAMHQDIYGKQAHHPAMADNLDNLGDLALQQQQQRDEAMTLYQHAYKMKKALYGEEEAHLAIALSHANIGRALLQNNQLEEALEEQEKALAMATAIYGEVTNIPIIGRLQREIGRGHQAMHNYDKAQTAYKTSLATYKALFGDQPHPDTAHTHYALGEVYFAQKTYAKALHHMSKAVTIRQAVYQQVSHHPTISEALLQLGRIHATQAQYDSAIHCYALATCCQVNHLGAISDLGQNLARFVLTNASLQKRLAQDEQPSPLHEENIVPFLANDPAQVLLLHGDAGAGKSLYGRFLEQKLWSQCPQTIEAMQTETYTIPLFINLPALQDPTQNAIFQALQQYGWDKETIAYFKAQLQQQPAIGKEEEKEAKAQPYQTKENVPPLGIDASFVIILDGYDEINHLTKPLNLYAAHQLNTWQAKVVVTCRTEHLESLSDHAHYFAPDGKGLTERYIRPFDAQQIDHYLDKIAQEASAEVRTANHWTKEKYQDELKQIPSLQELMKSPFLLRIITTILPQLQSKDNREITRTAVYTTFIDRWIQKELTRMQITGTAANQKTKDAKSYAAELGFELFFQEEQVLHTNSPGKAWQRFFEDAQALTYLALLPLRKVGVHQYQFIHKSCQEFFAAQHIHHSLAQLHAAQEDLQVHFAQQVKPYQPSDRDVATQEAQTYSRYATSCPPINQKLLKTEPAIIAFLQDGLWKRKVNIEGFTPSLLQQWLFSLIAASANNPKVAIAATNAITILATRVSLADQTWNGIQIPDAVLDRAFLLRTDMQGANLNRVSLREAYLEGAQCQQAQVAGLDFGEYPYFKHDDGVNSVCWSHDDRFLASASEDKCVRVWDPWTGQQVQICQEHTDSVRSVSWSHDDRFLASASGSYEGSDHTVCVWDAQRGGQVQICLGHTDAVSSVSWSHDDRFLASASDDKSVRVWDAKTGEQVQIFLEHEKEVFSVSWSHDDRFLASASEDYTVRVWDPQHGEQVQIFLEHTSAVWSVSWSNDDRFLASASEDHSVRVWDAKTGEQVQICLGHTNYVYSVSWSHDSHFLASASDDKTVRIWDTKTGQQVQICQGHDNLVQSVSWSHDDRFLASASADHTVRVWAPKTDSRVQICHGHTDSVWSVSWSHDDRFLASASGSFYGQQDYTIRVWDSKSGVQVQICLGHEGEINSVSWSHDGRFLASASDDKTVRVWDPKTGQQVQICQGHSSRVSSVSWSHDDRFLASASEDNTVRVWDRQTGQQVQICQGHTDSVWSVSWSHDDRFLASASGDKTVRVWDTKTGGQVQICQGHDNSVWSVSWSHDDRFLASASGDHYEDSEDNTVRVWDSKSGAQVRICHGHNRVVNSVSWSHDDRFLASASGTGDGNQDNTVRVWDPKTGGQVQICQGHDDAVQSVSWSHDDRFLASASGDKTVRVWEPVIMSNDEPNAIIGNRTTQSELSLAQSTNKDKRTLLKKCRLVLVIGRWNGLVLKDADFSGAVGLSEMNGRLICQRNGIATLAWFEAAQNGNEKLLRALYNSHINSRDKDNNTALIFSAQNGHLDCLELLLQKGADINAKNTKGNTALIQSAYNEHIPCVKYLVEQGADIHAKNEKGDTALILSALKGHLACVKCLLQQGAYIHDKNAYENTALILSALKGNLDCVQYLVEQGANVTFKGGYRHKTALAWAKEKGHNDVVQYLSNLQDKN